MHQSFLFAAITCSAFASHAQAQVLLADVGSDEVSSSLGTTLPLVGSFVTTPRTGASSFSLDGSRIVERASIFIQEDTAQPWSGTISYAILGDFFDISPTDTVFAQGTVDAFTDEIAFQPEGSSVVTRRIDFDLLAPAPLDGGNYWLAIMPTQDPNAGAFAWRFSNPDSGATALSVNNDFSSWSLQQGDAAFQLFGQIPSPGAIAILCIAPVFSGRRRQS